MKKQADILWQNATFQLQGEVDFANVMSVYEKSLPLIARHSPLVFDFSQLTASHSAVLALMIEWMKHAKKQNKTVRFVNLSADMLSIAKAAGMDKLLSTLPEG